MVDAGARAVSALNLNSVSPFDSDTTSTPHCPDFTARSMSEPSALLSCSAPIVDDHASVRETGFFAACAEAACDPATRIVAKRIAVARGWKRVTGPLEGGKAT